MAVMGQKCTKGHKQSWRCSQRAPKACQTCERETKLAEKKARKVLEDNIKRDENKQKHLRAVAKIEEEIEDIVQRTKDSRIESEQSAVLAQKRKDLAAAKNRANAPPVILQQDNHSDDETVITTPPTAQSGKTEVITTKPSKSKAESKNQLRQHIKTAVEHNKSASKTEWQRQKDQENAINPAIDEIIGMTGLENVKSQVLRIKAKVETSTRQQTDLKRERLGLVLLGNPGTGSFSSIHQTTDTDLCRQDDRGETLCEGPHVASGP